MATSLQELLASHRRKVEEAKTKIEIPAPSALSILASLSKASETDIPEKLTPPDNPKPEHPTPSESTPDPTPESTSSRIEYLEQQDEQGNISKEEAAELTELSKTETTAIDFSNHQITDQYGNTITLNANQWRAVELALAGESFCLIGPAGTGKTTTMKAVFQALWNAGKLPIMSGHGHKYLPENAPGVSISAFTRRATNNIRRNVSADLQANCITIHKLLEYEPVFYEEVNDAGKLVNKMSFEPARNSMNPLPASLSMVAFEEGSMIAVQLYNEVDSALPHNPQKIILGDIQQLPPVFGQAILGFKMLEWPVVELTEVYRQALESPILKLAHRILSGVPIPKSEFASWNVEGKLKIHPWQKRIAADSATLTLAKFFIHALDKEMYNPESDAILIPFNKSCGTDELNKHIANKIAKTQEKTVWEVIHGFKKSYFSVGDKVLYDREDAIITNIYTNPTYSGARAQSESKALDYWGNKKRTEAEEIAASTGNDDDDVDFILAQVALSSGGDDEDRVRACSHCIELTLLDSERTVTINQAGQMNNLILGYAITVHKSQGSEWDKVFLCLHGSHATMMQRELLYTAVTRAKRELFIICEEDSFEKGIKSQRIKGDTLAEKAEYFKGKLDNGELQS